MGEARQSTARWQASQSHVLNCPAHGASWTPTTSRIVKRRSSRARNHPSECRPGFTYSSLARKLISHELTTYLDWGGELKKTRLVQQHVSRDEAQRSDIVFREVYLRAWPFPFSNAMKSGRGGSGLVSVGTPQNPTSVALRYVVLRSGV